MVPASVCAISTRDAGARPERPARRLPAPVPVCLLVLAFLLALLVRAGKWRAKGYEWRYEWRAKGYIYIYKYIYIYIYIYMSAMYLISFKPYELNLFNTIQIIRRNVQVKGYQANIFNTIQIIRRNGSSQR